MIHRNGRWAGYDPDTFPEKESQECQHRGDETRQSKCKTCSGNVMIKVFACTVHTECAISKNIGVQTCENCPDKQS